MKKTFLFCLLLGTTLVANATVRTVNNTGGGQYTDINSAVVASAVGDTVYICGSVTSYTPPSTRKDNMVFIGTGFNVQNQTFVKSTIASGAFNLGSNNRLIGLVIAGQINYLDGCAGIYLQRCNLSLNFSSTGNYQCVNMTLEHCVVTGSIFLFSKFTNLIISNSVFYANANLNVFNQIQAPNNAVVDHCVFVAAAGSPQLIFAGSPPATGFSFSNNIFFNSIPNTVSTYSFINNYSSSANLNTYGYGNITSSVWPFFTNQAAVTGAFNYIWDFSVLTSSSAHNAATDGTDMGAYGGPKPFQWDGEPAIPQMDLMNIMGTQFTPGSTMQINFQSSVQD